MGKEHTACHNIVIPAQIGRNRVGQPGHAVICFKMCTLSVPDDLKPPSASHFGVA
jgi:hypothetical protein